MRELGAGEVGRVVAAEEEGNALELFAVAGGDGDSDGDVGVADVVAGTVKGAREGVTDLGGGEEFEGEGYAGCRWDQSRCNREKIEGTQRCTHRCPFHFAGPSLKICKTAGPTSCSASSQGSSMSG